MNVVLLLTPKNELVYLDDTMSINDALKKLRENRYTAIPLIDSENGRYLGTLSEGDLLWYLTSPEGKKADLDQEKAVQLLRPDFIPAVHIDSELNDVFYRVLNQNFVPVVDDRGVLTGIVTRRAVIACMLERMPKQ